MVDLRNCRKGDKLLTKQGKIVTYVGPYHEPYPHQIEYEGGGFGTRTDDGHVYKYNRLPSDEDIVKILSPSVRQLAIALLCHDNSIDEDAWAILREMLISNGYLDIVNSVNANDGRFYLDRDNWS